ncbi:MAG: DNA mismatch repair protein MutS [Candidatus Babeliaceae bacterium]|jgi:DNA mismatch repair protein MutS
MTTLSPLMRQYTEIKNAYPDALLLFQVGDFYELFFNDAVKASAFLGITLTKRGTTSTGDPIPLCGVPVHTLDHYLLKLVRGGFCVAICDQLTQAVPGRVVERGVKRVLTPGTLTDSQLLNEKSASYLAIVVKQDTQAALLFVELLTGHMFLTILNIQDASLFESELSRFSPDEIVVPEETSEKYIRSLGFFTTSFKHNNAIDDAAFQAWYATLSITARDIIDHSTLAHAALVLFYQYIKKNNTYALAACTHLYCYTPDDYLLLDASTQRNLELVKNTYDGTTAHTLFAVLDHAVTSMGSRMIKKWITRPLVKRTALEQRIDAVDYCKTSLMLRQELRELLQGVADIERVVGRFALKRALITDYKHLIKFLTIVPEIAHKLSSASNDMLNKMCNRLGDFDQLRYFLERAIEVASEQESLIKKGFSAQLDQMRVLLNDGAVLIQEIEAQEQERTGISSLKIRYSQAHGYGIEVTKTHVGRVPDDYMRLQTLVNRERYTTERLREVEYNIAHARSNINSLEKEIMESITVEIEKQCSDLKKSAQTLATLDAILGFAHAAYVNRWVKPQFHESRDIIISGGKHPVVSHRLAQDFIPNDTLLTDEQSLMIITGPNMGGKSTYLRQVALISIMAQAGSCVSADSARLPIVDKIFTRIGAADNVAQGKSTFLVEMEETALICRQATSKSLVILDEVGRGTSTYDGLAIAWAVIEYIYFHVQARCLFATHYHELTALTDQHPGMIAYHAASSSTERGILLLHKIIPGVAQGSFGLEVAKKAYIPERIIDRARVIMSELNTQHPPHAASASSTNAYMQELEKTCNALKKEVAQYKKIVAEMQSIDYDALSPRQAFDILWRLRQP